MTVKLDQNQIEGIVRLAAKTDALFLPIRPNGVRDAAAFAASAARWERVRDYWTDGVAFVGGGQAVDRKSHQRLVVGLEELGLVQVMRNDGQRCGVALTSAGDDLARWLCGMFTFRDSWKTLRAIAAFDRRQVPETWLAGEYETPGVHTKVMALEQELLPALVRGWLVANWTVSGAVNYFVQPAMVSGLAVGKPDWPDWLRKQPKNRHSSYMSHLNAELRRKVAWKPLGNNLWIPMAATPIPQKP